MANFLNVLFGSKYPSTQKYEEYLIKLKNDYERYIEFKESSLLIRYNELDKEIHTGSFEKKVEELKNLKFKNSPQWRQLDQYNTLKSSSDIKRYLKIVKGDKLSRMEMIKESDLYKEYKELLDFVNSPKFHAAKSKKGFKKSEEYLKFQQLKSLKKNPEIIFYNRTERSNDYKTAIALKGSDRLETYFELEGIVQSKEFKEQEAFLKDKKRFQKSKEAELIEEFKLLNKNEEILWFLKMQKEKPFEDYKKWQLTFEEDFDQIKLDANKWMTGYYWGRALMNDNYVPSNEHQFFTDENIDLRNSMARISVREEKTVGKSWNTSHGFNDREFNFTSGLISTGQSFRQKYGRLEAKIRFDKSYPVVNAFWLVGETKSPQIDIFRTTEKNNKGYQCGIHSDKESRSKLIKGSFSNNKFFIYGLNWSADELIWTINGKEVHREVNNIPNESMYLTFCSILPEEPKSNNLPASMEIDWIRCYKKAKA